MGWYAAHLQTSFSWLQSLNLAEEATIIDVGGGASTWVDDLLDAGYRNITVLDISEDALASVKKRLGKRADAVSWITADITSVELPTQYFDVWHDRAVFHFLTEPKQQQEYRDTLYNAIKPGGHLIIGTFTTEAPPKCSGLPVQRYNREQLETVMGDPFSLIRHHKELHVTPGGVKQMYLYCDFIKRA